MGAAVLVEAARDGDEQALELLLQPLLEPGYRLACGILHDPQAAEDAVQEAAVKAWRKLDRLREGARPWFLGIVANACRSTLRSQWWSAVASLRPDMAGEGRDDSVVTGLTVRRALRGIDYGKRLVIVLHWYLDLPLREVALVTGLSEHAVESRLHRGIEELGSSPRRRGMETDRLLKAEVRVALEAVTPPAPWLGTRLRESVRERHRGVPHMAVAIAVAALVVTAIAAGVAVGVTAGIRYSNSVPAMDPATKRYVSMVAQDYQRWHGAVLDYWFIQAPPSYECSTPVRDCPPADESLKAPARKFLADLERTTPPAEFAGQDARLRQELAGWLASLDQLDVAAAEGADEPTIYALWTIELKLDAEIANDATDIIYADRMAVGVTYSSGGRLPGVASSEG